MSEVREDDDRETRAVALADLPSHRASHSNAARQAQLGEIGRDDQPIHSSLLLHHLDSVNGVCKLGAAT
jgi:hypothetical protein